MKIVYGQEIVNELRARSEKIKSRLWIAAPFIGKIKSVLRILGKQWVDESNISVRLLTDINEISNYSYETIQTFCGIGEIKHLTGLHAKICITDDSCFITSANLTNTAFSKRYEIGIFLDGVESRSAISIYKSLWNLAESVAFEDIEKLVHKNEDSSKEIDRRTLPKLWNLPERPVEINYWLKPIGVTGEPVTSDWTFEKLDDNLHFSKRRPKSVKPNDILIAYGVGDGRILSVYLTSSNPKKITQKELKDEWLSRCLCM